MNRSPISLSEPGHQHRHLPPPAHPMWIFATLFFSYGLNLMFSLFNQVWLPDVLALTLAYWAIYQPRVVGMTIAFVCGLLMDVHNGSVLGQQSLAYVTLTYLALMMHRRVTWFGAGGQALHILPILLISQLIVLLIRLWFDGLWPGISWFSQSFTGALMWPLVMWALSSPQRRRKPED